jgi:putative hydrolase of the HAD superfamily
VNGLDGRVVRAVTVDLDDTLFDQRNYLDGAWHAVAAAAAVYGAAPEPLLAALADIAAEGTDQGRIIDRALERCGIAARPELVSDLLTAFRAHRPAELSPYPGVLDTLRSLRQVVALGCVTDGNPDIQRAKLTALGLDGAFDTVVVSDEIGRQFRKPHAVPFLFALHELGVLAADAVHVGDRPQKDIAGPHRLGMAAVRVRTGEYADAPDGDSPPDLCFADAAGALRFLREAALTGSGDAARPSSPRPAGQPGRTPT